MAKTQEQAEPVKIYQAIAAIMAEVGPIEKSRKNHGQNYDFRGIDDIYNALHPLLAKHKVFVVPIVADQKREERASQRGGALLYTILTVAHRFYADDGSFVEAVTVGEAMDSGDKASNKAMSAAMKYALIEVFAIATGEDSDTENHNHHPEPKTSEVPAEIKPLAERF